MRLSCTVGSGFPFCSARRGVGVQRAIAPCRGQVEATGRIFSGAHSAMI